MQFMFNEKCFQLHTVPKEIDFPLYNMKCSGENKILRGIRAGRAFLDSRSRLPGVLGTQERDFFKARGNAELEEVGTLILRA